MRCGYHRRSHPESRRRARLLFAWASPAPNPGVPWRVGLREKECLAYALPPARAKARDPSAQRAIRPAENIGFQQEQKR